MKILSIDPLAVPDVKVITFGRFRDHRGYFTETCRKSDLFGPSATDFLAGLEFLQCNESFSRPGVVRGLHFQWNPHMGKLVRTIAGRMIDLALDIRKGSPTHGKIVACDMPASADDDCGRWIWVPAGFAHGNFFSEPTTIEYFCTGEYSPGCEAGIRPTAEDIDWSLCDAALKAEFDKAAADGSGMSEKDRAGLTLAAWGADDRSKEFIHGRC